MSPQARDRAREKRRNIKQQTKLDMREVEAKRNRQVIGIVLAMVVVIGGFVGLTMALNQDDETAPGSQATPQPSASATSARTLPDKVTAAGKTFTATVTTSRGVITMELDGTKAPQTVASFLGLARSAYWANSPCHRLTTEGIFVLQCGDPTGTGSGNPGYGFGVENAPADFTFPPGTLAMARTNDPESNGGQFFIVYKETVLKDPIGYSIFGKVTSGMGIVDQVAAAGVDESKAPAPKQPISILKVDVTEKKASQ